MTFVDHRSGIVANGSALGKLYAANVFNALYGRSQQLAMDPSRRPEARSWQEAYPASHPAREILELFDMQVNEERQLEQRRKKKKRKNSFRKIQAP